MSGIISFNNVVSPAATFIEKDGKMTLSTFNFIRRMPASSAIDFKDRIMGGGVSAVARRRGSVHRLSESWEVGDYGQKDQDYRA